MHKKAFVFIISLCVTQSFSPSHKNFIVNLNTILIPNTLSKALTKIEWRNSMREEMDALEKNKTWEIVE